MSTVDEPRWLEIEYHALREEILALTSERHSTIRFCLPAAASVYAVPHLLQQTSKVYLWTFSAFAASLLLLAMVRTLWSCTVGIWRLSAHIKESIEPRTNGQLMWETINYQTRQGSSWVGHNFVVASVAVVANILAAGSVGWIFTTGYAAGVPGLAAAVPTLITIPSLVRLARQSHERKQIVESISAALRE